MRVVYPVCCGVDVHKSFLVATMITTHSHQAEPVYHKKRYSTFHRSLVEFKEWLLESQCFDVCMESTGKYWIPVFNVLEGLVHVTLANPKWVSAVKGNKDDVKDSRWIGDLFRLGLVPGSFIPCKEIRVLRELTRYRTKLVACKASEKNRYQNALTVCNLSLDSVASSMFGKSATAIVNHVVGGQSLDSEQCRSLLHGAMRGKVDQVLEAVEGFQMEAEQRIRLRVIQSHMAYLDGLIALLDEEIDRLTESYTSHIKLLCSIPGVKHLTAVVVLSEIGTDMSMFGSSKRLCSWAGLVPGNNQSAGKKKSVRISRAGVYLKPALVQAAHAAVKDRHCDYYGQKYRQIAKRRGKKRAIIAIARMILAAVYAMLQTGETFCPHDMIAEEEAIILRIQKHHQALKDATKLLQAEGIEIPEAFVISLTG